jgi:predicted phosphodiesterase
MRVAVVCLVCLVTLPACGAPPEAARSSPPQVVGGTDEPPLILRPVSLKFAVIGDSGRWSRQQRETAAQLVAQRDKFPFDFVLMLGDNNYGDGSVESYRQRFEEPFKPLLDHGVKFYAALGNHDLGAQWNYPLFNMGGHRYYTFERHTGLIPPVAGDRVQFFALDSVNLDGRQIAWFTAQLAKSKADWKIVYLHHPLYSTGRYGFSAALMRRSLERPLVEHDVDVVFAGHEHFYERLPPQGGVVHFVSGAAGSVRTGDRRPSGNESTGYDGDLSFMLLEIAGNTIYFRAINRLGEIVDSGKIVRTKRASS